MKSIYIFFLAIFISCNPKRTEHQQNNIPETLQDNKKSSATIFSKRGFDDLVDELYKEKLEKDPSLRKIAKDYQDLKENKSDSLNEFNSYEEKNNNYYSSADRHLKEIQDSSLNNEISAIVTSSKNRFIQKTSYLNSLEKKLNKESITTTDRYAAIKILITLDMIESYQDVNPWAKPIESILNQFRVLNTKLDSVIKKNK